MYGFPSGQHRYEMHFPGSSTARVMVHWTVLEIGVLLRGNQTTIYGSELRLLLRATSSLRIHWTIEGKTRLNSFPIKTELSYLSAFTVMVSSLSKIEPGACHILAPRVLQGSRPIQSVLDRCRTDGCGCLGKDVRCFRFILPPTFPFFANLSPSLFLSNEKQSPQMYSYGGGPHVVLTGP